MPQSPLERYRQLVSSGQADVFAFLASCGPTSVDDKRNIVLLDQQWRWSVGQTIVVEEYLERLPELAAENSAVYALAMSEHITRFGSNSAIDRRALVSRFPQLANYISQKSGKLVSEEGPSQLTEGDALQTESFQPQSSDKVLQARYRIQRLLGEGSFGSVYLALDLELERQVAIKLPKPARFQRAGDSDMYLTEARTVAALHHPHIVPVYDMGRTSDGSLFVVSRFIEGQTLEQFARERVPEIQTVVRLLAPIAQALQYAHSQRIIHRDVKPANILIEQASQLPFITDFGLAIREEDLGRTPGGGTPAYMSPEQVRGEGHRLDGRSDVFSLGVILYELLTSCRPFRGSTNNELFHQIISVEPPAPRSVKQNLPVELERICLKALSKQVSHRYTAAEFADELQGWLQSSSSLVATVATTEQVMPKGLRAFDSEDAVFFLDLLPGPRNRVGLPESISFWKSRIEEQDPEKTFAIGLLLGPSGCGKSSLVKAGLLPRVSDHVQVIYIEATPDETESRLLRALVKARPELAMRPDPSAMNAMKLSDHVAQLRRASDGKVTIIIDQFEQWLYAQRVHADSELVKALRQCDGGNVQTILMVRDDFAMAAARLMQELDVRIVQGENFATVDLFDLDHASRVLTLFGQAFGKLPHDLTQLSTLEKEFIQEVIAGLAVEGKVVSVHLALLAEMIKSKAWIPETLKQVGGTQGVGVSFLEETFSSPTANPAHRLHAPAARAVLSALLPQMATDIKGHMRSQAELLELSGYADRPNQFRLLMLMLDGELRLITPTDPEGHSSQSAYELGQQYFQLTHDYLVPSLRFWLTSKQRETAQGRAQLKLAERAAQWNARTENKQLPTLLEWLSIRRWISPTKWTMPERVMMRRADKLHATRSAIAALSALVILMAGLAIRSNIAEQTNAIEARRLVEGILAADTAQLPTSLTRLTNYRQWSDPLFSQAFVSSEKNSNEKLHAALSLVANTNQPNAEAIEYLKSQYLRLAPLQLAPVRKLLEPHPSIAGYYWAIANDTTRPASERFHAACALAGFDPDNDRWRDDELCSFVAGQLVSVSPSYLGQYQSLLRPVRAHLLAPISLIFKDSARSEMTRSFATLLLADYAADNAKTLAELVVVADPEADKVLFPLLEKHRPFVIKTFEDLLAQELKPDWHDAPLDPNWKSATPATKAAIETASGMLEERTAFCQSMPWSQFLSIVETLRASGYCPTRVRPWLDGAEVKVAAVWKRDGRSWKLETIRQRNDLPAIDALATKDGLVLADVSRLPNLASTQPNWLALWIEPRDASEERRAVIDVTEDELLNANETMVAQGFVSQQILSVATDSHGARRYSSIWSKQGAPADARPTHTGSELSYEPQWDVSVAAAGRLLDPLQVFRDRLTALAAFPTLHQTEPENLKLRAEALFQLGKAEGALSDWETLIQQGTDRDALEPYRTIALARAGHEDQALESLERYLGSQAIDSFKTYTRIVVPAWLGSWDTAWEQLQAAEREQGDHNDELYNLACASAVCYTATLGKDAAQSTRFENRTIELLERLLKQKFLKVQRFTWDPDFASLHEVPRFESLLEKAIPPARFAGLWHANVDVNSRLIALDAAAASRQELKQLLSSGYRPHAITVDSQVSHLVLHLPLVPDAAKERLAKDQAAAAIALLRLDAADNVWPWLQDRPDPRMRSYMLKRLAQVSVDAETLRQRLTNETEVSQRRWLILGIGELARADQLNAKQKESLLEECCRLYANDPDSGIHGAAEWSLKQLKAEAKIEEIRRAMATGKPVGERQWYFTKMGASGEAFPVTMMVLNAHDEFFMGSPVSESDRFEGPTGHTETLHRRRIDRTIAISSHEITVAQFSAFRPKHEFNRSFAREPDAPANAISWYDAAEFCNWLSEQEGIAPDQWCYSSEHSFSEGMTLLPDYIERTGYRLPSEAEWEFACRSGTQTARHYGQTESLLGEYAWYTNVSWDKFMIPVGNLRPNATGLFDMLGNVLEWTQDDGASYDQEMTLDLNRMSTLKNSEYRVMRGGSYNYYAPILRSATRFHYRPNDRFDNYGFRVARTFR